MGCGSTKPENVVDYGVENPRPDIVQAVAVIIDPKIAEESRLAEMENERLRQIQIKEEEELKAVELKAAEELVTKRLNKCPPTCTGYMNKQGQNVGLKMTKEMKRRFFTLERGILTYYDREKPLPNGQTEGSNAGDVALGSPINLLNCTVTLPTDSAVSNKQIKITCPGPSGRILILEVSKETMHKKWIESLNAHVNFLNTEAQNAKENNSYL